MTRIDDAVTANATFARSFHGGLAAPPSGRLALVTCMDARIDPLAVFGLDIGEAHVIRNAGGLVTDDVLRSLVISQRALGTREIAIAHHTRCGLNGFDDPAFRAELTSECGAEPTWQVDGFSDVHDQARRSVELIRSCPWLPHRDQVRGFVFDVETGLLDEVG